MSLELSVNDLLENIRRVKTSSRELAKKYISYPHSIVSYARDLWGGVVTYRYEKISIDYDKTTRKLLLANLIAERYILKAYRDLFKHMTIAIVGLAGSGKTTYSVLSIYGALKLLGFSNEDIINYLGRYVLFEAREYVDVPLWLINNKLWCPVIVFDDVSSQITKYWHFIGETFWVYLFSVMDQLKDWTGVLVFTARSYTSIPARFREIIDIVVEAREVEVSGVVLDIFEYYYNTGQGYKNKKNLLYVDVMLPVARMPEHVWNRMMDIRREVGLKRLKVIHEVIARLPEIEEAKAKKLLEKVDKIMKEEKPSST